MTSQMIPCCLLTILTFVLARRPFTIKISEISCIRYGKTISELECHLDTVDNRTVVSGAIIFSEDVGTFQIRAFADLLRSTDAEPIQMFNLTLDGCKTLDTWNSGNIMKSLIADARKSGNFPDRCPLKANVSYFITRYAVDEDLLPLYTPEFNYLVETRLMVESKVIAKILAKGRVEMKHKNIRLKNFGK